MAAQYSDYPEVIQFMIDNGAKVNDSDPLYRSLHYTAAHNQNPAILQTLLDNGADVNAYIPTKHGFPGSGQEGPIDLLSANLEPLHLAAWFNDNPEVIRMLLENGANVHDIAEGRRARYSPLDLAAWNNENPAVVQTLLDYGARIHEPSFSLTLAVIHNRNPTVIQVLLDHGAVLGDFDEENCDRMSPEAKQLLQENNSIPEACAE